MGCQANGPSYLDFDAGSAQARSTAESRPQTGSLMADEVAGGLAAGGGHLHGCLLHGIKDLVRRQHRGGTDLLDRPPSHMRLLALQPASSAGWPLTFTPAALASRKVSLPDNILACPPSSVLAIGNFPSSFE